MNSFLYTFIMIGLWIVNLFNDTGLGAVYHTTERARIIIYVVFIFIAIWNFIHNRYYIDMHDVMILGGMAVFFVITSLIQGQGMMGIHYISAFVLIYILRKIGVTRKAVVMTGIAYLIMGIVILYIYDFGTALSGWNPNTIGMIALYSYLIFLIPFYNSEKVLRSKLILIAVTILYVVLIEPTDSRSCTLFALTAAILALSSMLRNLVIKSNQRYLGLLLIPLFIAVTVVWISKTSYINTLNQWSLEKFQKTIFNGRDVLWNQGFQLFLDNFLFGRGSLAGNWHNCMIGMLTSYGCLGAILWIASLQNILLKGRRWMNDLIVPGCVVTFLIMYIQQSVELGLVNEAPNLLPYIVLGMMLGRVNFLNKEEYFKGIEENGTSEHYYTDL